MAIATAYDYRRPWLDPADSLFRRCLSVNSVVGLALLIAMLFAPMRTRMITKVEQLPPRFARLILEPPKHAVKPGLIPTPAQSEHAQPDKGPGGGGGGGGGEHTETPKLVKPAVTAAPPTAAEVVNPNAGRVGRARAERAVRALSSTKVALAGALAGLSTSFGATASEVPIAAHGGRARILRSARGEADLSRPSVGLSGGTQGADLGHSVVVGSLISIGEFTSGPSSGSGGGSGGGVGGGLGGGTGDGVGPGSGGGTGGGSGGGVGTGAGGGVGPGSGGGGRRGPSAPGVYRSNASLLAVIQRYQAGIQYCYGNELKRDPTLRGKLVVAITVAASGEVLEASIVQNSVGSERLASCALSQIREWKFPAIPEGVTAFQAPFVFTPPS